jgi:predicted membrane metal-binding protein
LAFICALFFHQGENLQPAIVLFPWTFIASLFTDVISVPFLIAGFFQFPIYGFLIDIQKTKNAKLPWLIMIAISHIILVLLSIAYGKTVSFAPIE